MSESTGDAANPLDQKRKLMDLLSQETRHKILQFILGHPAHLASADELDYMITSRSKKAIEDQLAVLVTEDILAKYHHAPNEGVRDYPSYFFGPTEYGVEVLGDFGYLDGVPFVRAVYENTRMTDRIERHRTAPRPSLPSAVQQALDVDDSS